MGGRDLRGWSWLSFPLPEYTDPPALSGVFLFACLLACLVILSILLLLVFVIVRIGIENITIENCIEYMLILHVFPLQWQGREEKTLLPKSPEKEVSGLNFHPI